MVDESISILIAFAEDTQNCFDEYLQENKSKISGLSAKQLRYLIIARERCQKLSRIAPFTRDEIKLCFDEGLISDGGLFAQVCDDFLISDSFFN